MNLCFIDPFFYKIIDRVPIGLAAAELDHIDAIVETSYLLLIRIVTAIALLSQIMELHTSFFDKKSVFS